MKLAFLISVQKDARHLRDLVASLPVGADYYIHVDRHRDLQHFERLVKGENIHFLTQRVRVIPGSLNEVAVQVALIRAALAGDADYLVAIDGLDYPLWSNARIEEFFSDADGRQFIRGIAMRSGAGSV